MEENMNMTPEQLCALIQKQIDQLEQQMANMCGMKLYKKVDGFSQNEIYTLCGRNDDVATITLRPGSDGETSFGNNVTVCFSYTKKKREKLEQDSASLDDIQKIKAKSLLPDYDKDKALRLLSEGINRTISLR